MYKTISLINKLDKERILKLFKNGYSISFPENKKEDFIKTINKAKAVTPQKIPPDLITMRSKFRLRDIGTGENYEYTLVYPEEVDSDRKISILDFSGTSIFGSKRGDIVKWSLNRGEKYFQIVEILYQPEAFGHWEL